MAEPIRVLCVFSSLNRGGAESMCMSLYRHIDRTQIQFDFVKHTPHTGHFEEEIRSLGGRIFEAPQYKIYNHLSYVQWWKRYLKKHPEYKLIHGHFFTISAIYFNIAKQFGRKTIAHSHASYRTPKSCKEKLKRKLCSRIEKYSDVQLACSKPAGDWLFPQKGYQIFRNAIDTERYVFSSGVREQVRQELRLEGCFVAGTVGNIAEVKNPYGILEIIKQCRAKRSDFRFLWVGGGGLWDEIYQKVQRMGLGDTVIMTGVRSDVNRLLQAMDVFILPSFSEGLPVVAVEAQSAGLPCLIADVVTEEVVLTERCHRFPLEQYSLWVQEILTVDCTSRKDEIQVIVDAGYDIHTTTTELQERYLKLNL